MSLFCVLTLTGFSQCGDDGDDVDAKVELQYESVAATDNAQFINVYANGQWNLKLRYVFDEEEEPYQWCYIDDQDLSGSGVRRNIIMRFDQNPYSYEREVYLQLYTGGQTLETRFIQMGTNTGQPAKVTLAKDEVYSNEVSQFIRVYSNGEWTLALEYEEGGQDGWASVDPQSGFGIRNDVLLSYQKNNSGVDRNVTVVLKSGGQESRATLKQFSQAGELLDLLLTDENVDATETGQKVNVQADGAWTLTIEYPSGTAAWCILNPTSGTDSQIVNLTYTANTNESPRQATIVLTSGTRNVKKTLTQAGRYIPPTPTEGGWLELPEMSGLSANEKFVTHETTIGGKKMRNYSMLFDTNERIAYWVAYPHHNVYVGNSGRTDDWQYDPKIPTSQQANLSKGISGYDRGHQIPSGDRTANSATNAQTFYYSNMTPQLSRLNQDRWVKLENKVRGWLGGSDKPDTLYVVTGAILRTTGGSETVKYATDRSGNKIAVPNYYFKVLLHRKNDNYRSIGFWFQHKQYPNTDPDRNDIKTVRQIEELTGFNFFASLPQAVQDQVETTVTYSAWGY